MTNPRFALVVEPEDSPSHLVDRVLQLDGWSVYHVSTVADALRQLCQRHFDVICCEYDAEAGLDEAAIGCLQAACHGQPLIVTSARGRGARAAHALRTPFLRQPCATDEVGSAFGALLATA